MKFKCHPQGAPRQHIWVSQICGPRSTPIFSVAFGLATNRNHFVMCVKFNKEWNTISAHPSIEIWCTRKNFIGRVTHRRIHSRPLLLRIFAFLKLIFTQLTNIQAN